MVSAALIEFLIQSLLKGESLEITLILCFIHAIDINFSTYHHEGHTSATLVSRLLSPSPSVYYQT